jgi:hypothetical protein
MSTQGAKKVRRSSPVHTVIATNVYTLAAAAEALGLRTNTLPREVRLKRLRASKRGGRYYILGSWLLEWIETGEVRHAVPDRDGEGAGIN